MTREEHDERIRLLNRLCAEYAAEKNDERANALEVDIRLALPPGHRQELAALIKNGPVWDGDVCSKAHVGDLIRWRLAVKVMVNGQWGYTAATYLGGHVMSERVEVTS